MENDDVIVEEIEELTWWQKTKDKIVKFCKGNPDVALTVFAGVMTMVGGAFKLAAASKGYPDEVYMTDGENVYKLPAREIKDSKKVKTVKSV